MAVLMSTAVGLPVSTSHCLVGALIGVGIAGQCAASNDHGVLQTRNAPLDFTVLKKIVLAWYARALLSFVDRTSEATTGLLLPVTAQ